MDVEKEEKKLIQDIRRAIILGGYVKEWKLPEHRIISANDLDEIEFYSFPPLPGEKVFRIASVGMSSVRKENGDPIDFELLMTLPPDLGGVELEDVANFMMDLFAFSLSIPGAFDVPKTMPETSLMPSKWFPKAILLDDPRGENEDLAIFDIGSEKVRLLWVIPIYAEEQRLIVEEGIGAFDKLQCGSDFSLVDIRRPSLLN